jgi:hypothetical protein
MRFACGEQPAGEVVLTNRRLAMCADELFSDYYADLLEGRYDGRLPSVVGSAAKTAAR